MAVQGSIGGAGTVLTFTNPTSINCTMPEGQYPNGQITFDNIVDGGAYWKNNGGYQRSINLYLCDSAGNNRVFLFTVTLTPNGSNTTVRSANISGATGLMGKALYIVATGDTEVVQLRRATSITINTAYGTHTIATTGMAHGDFTISNLTPLTGETVTVTVTPWAGYTAGTPTSSPAVTMTSAGTNKWTFVMPNADITLSFPEGKISYNLTKSVSPSGGGTLTLDRNTATVGDTVTITATPATGYRLKTLSTSPSRTITNNKFTMPAQAVTVSAVFEKIEYTVSKGSNPNGGGTVTTNKANAYYGDTITVSQTPATGYFFDGWETSPANLIANGANSFSMPAQNVSITAKYLLRSTASVNKSEVTDGDTIKLTIIPNKASYKHKYKLSFGSGMETSLTLVNAGTTVVNITLPSGNNSWSKNLTNAESKAGTLLVETYNGDTKIGEYTITGLTYKVPESLVPSLGEITTSIERTINNVTYANVGNVYVQGKCGVRIQVTGYGVNNSTVSKIEVSLSSYSGNAYNKTINSNAVNYVTGLLSIAGIITITAKVTDSRGRTATRTTTIDVKAYTAPQGTLSVWRVDALGNTDYLGQYAKYKLTGSQCNVGNNALTKSITALGITRTVSADEDTIFNGDMKTFDRLTEYTITLTLTDSFGTTTTINTKLATAQFMLFFGANGDRMALMKATNNSLSKNGKNGVIELSGDAQVYMGTDMLEDYIRKTYQLGGTTIISSAVNLNTLISVGVYLIQSSEVAAACTNIPVGNAGKLKVENVTKYHLTANAPWSYFVQEYETILGDIFIRSMISDVNGTISFGAWKRITNTTNIDYTTASNTNSTIWTGGTISLRKCNGIVQIKFDSVVLAATTQRTAFASIPAGYRPPTQSYFRDNTNILIVIDTDGTIKTEASAQRTTCGNGTYLAG